MSSRSQLIDQARAALQLEGEHRDRMAALISLLDHLRAYAETDMERETLQALRVAAEALVGVKNLMAVEQEKLRALAHAWLRFELKWDSA